jgi:hypothetical protein
VKGILTKTDNGWQVSHATYDMILERWIAGKLPLHPDDIKQINADAQVFDNIEARIAAYPEVEFEVVISALDFEKYAKLTKTEPKPKIYESPDKGETIYERSAGDYTSRRTEVAKDYPKLEGTMNLCNDITKKRTGKMTEEEWQAAERAQTSTKTVMTAKEKANQLVQRFYFSLPNNGSQTGINNVHSRWEEGKMCALIAIDEIIRVTPWGGGTDNEIENGSKEFYMKVKEEIEKR